MSVGLCGEGKSACGHADCERRGNECEAAGEGASIDGIRAIPGETDIDHLVRHPVDEALRPHQPQRHRPYTVCVGQASPRRSRAVRAANWSARTACSRAVRTHHPAHRAALPPRVRCRAHRRNRGGCPATPAAARASPSPIRRARRRRGVSGRRQGRRSRGSAAPPPVPGHLPPATSA